MGRLSTHDTSPVSSSRRADGHLSEANRAILHGLIRAKGHLSGAQLARLYLARTGEAIHRYSVNKARRLLASDRPGNRHLPERQAATLEFLIREAASDGPVSPSSIARLFEATEGRRITKESVRARVLKMGLPTGRDPVHRLLEPGFDMRLDAAHARKLAKSKVDRSERPGRVGRVAGAIGGGA